jgi:nicotinate-nucleotide--dimethylbenzimidazole phosphoribosyltransferase
VLAERRDIRRFRPDPVPERAPAGARRRPPGPVGGPHKPWRFIVARAARIAVRQIAQRERLRQADRFGPRAS